MKPGNLKVNGESTPMTRHGIREIGISPLPWENLSGISPTKNPNILGFFINIFLIARSTFLIEIKYIRAM